MKQKEIIISQIRNRILAEKRKHETTQPHPNKWAKIAAAKIYSEYLTTQGDEWISVNDRLPKQSMMCLIYNKESGISIARWSNRNATYGLDDKEYWFWRSGNKKYSKKNITHWQPLLSPPKP